MKHVAVLGGGPAGAFAAELLARAGVRTTVFDEKLAWEKPCGGGLTYKAYHRYPFLRDSATPKQQVTRTVLRSGTKHEAAFALTQPLLIYSRQELNGMLLDRAAAAGAQLEKSRVVSLERSTRVTTKAGVCEADFCLVAMGARNPLRTAGTAWSAGDTMSSLGYFVPRTQEHVDLEFFPGFEGYIWVFPRRDHLSVGIAGKGLPTAALREMLHRYMAEHDLPVEGSSVFGHVIPSLERTSWAANRVSGEGWLALGDAAGLVDPVTGEGLYYAMRSAELAVTCLLEHGPGEAPEAYRTACAREFFEDLQRGAYLSKRLFTTHFLGDFVSTRMIALTQRSPAIRHVVQDLFAGTQDYLTLKSRLKRVAPNVVSEVLSSFARRNART